MTYQTYADTLVHAGAPDSKPTAEAGESGPGTPLIDAFRAQTSSLHEAWPDQLPEVCISAVAMLWRKLLSLMMLWIYDNDMSEGRL